MVGRNRHSHAYSDIPRHLGRNYRSITNARPQIICFDQNCHQVAVGENHQEFLATVSTHDIVYTQLRTKPFRDFLQRFVAKKMPQCVVHFLEVVDIGQYDAEWFSTTLGPR
jgi:hypothetical protein